jgi:AraC family transcriptional regulator
VTEPAIDNTAALKAWFQHSGVSTPLHTCIGPLPASRASIVRWTSEQADQQIQTIGAHRANYRIAVMLEPVHARIWSGGAPVWGGVIAANRFRVCPPSAASQWSRTSGCDIANLFIPVATVDALNEQRHTPVPMALAARQFTADRQVLDLVRKMLDAPALAGPLAPHYCDSLVTALVAYLLEHHSQPSARQEQSTLGGARLRKVLAHMAGNLGEDVSNGFMAELCGMSEAHFSREFHRAIGLPPHRYMMKLRLEQACAALVNADTRIVDIAQECGFHDASHFSRAFAQHFGMPPASFRRQRRT